MSPSDSVRRLRVCRIAFESVRLCEPVGCALAASLLVVASATPASAQEELGRLAFEYVAPGGFTDSPAGAENVDVGTVTFRAATMLPVPVGEKTALLLGAGYSLLVPQIDGLAADTSDFHEVGVTVGVTHTMNAQWQLLAAAAPSIASDFRDPSGDAINVRAFALANVDLNPSLRFGFGLSAAYQFGRLLPLPLLTLTWRPNPETALVVSFPTTLSFSYTLWNRLDLGAMLRLRGGRYERSGEGVFAGVDNLRTTTVDIGPRASVRLHNLIWLEAYAGVTLFRNFELFESAGDSLFDGQLNNAFVAQVALVVRAPQGPRDSETPR